VRTLAGCFWGWKQGWRRALDLEGRAGLWEYWCFKLGNALLAGLYAFVVDTGPDFLLYPLYPFYLAWGLASFTLLIRRLHDLGLSALALLFYLVPLLNLVLMAMVAFFPGERGTNPYGPPPRFPQPGPGRA